MGIIERTYGKDTGAVVNEVLISSDSHVIEPAGLWQKKLPKAFQNRAPDYGGQRPNDTPGGAQDKNKRVAEMKADGVSAEVLYPTHGLKCLSLDDHELEAACCQVYNDWLIDYCSAAPERMIGITMLSMYDIDGAVKELERCRKAGMRGSVIWQVPPPELPFSSSHYDKFWTVSQDLDMPVNLHILSGHGYSASRSFGQGDKPTGMTAEHNSVNMKLFQSVDSLYDLIYSGVLERFPKLKIVLVENELGWIPFVLEQWDYYFKRHGAKREGLNITKPPSEYFHKQILPRSSTTPSAAIFCRGGDRTTACGPTTSRTATRPGQTPARSSAAISAVYRRMRAPSSCARTSRGSTTFRFLLRCSSSWNSRRAMREPGV